MLANPWVRHANNWLHDIGTGLWAACLLVLWVLHGYQPEMAGAVEAWQVLADVALMMFRLMLAALVVIAVTGGLRLAYWRTGVPAEEMPTKRPALIGKHVAFLLVYGLGTIYAYTLLWPSV